ncbi:MAG: sensor histidine kinase [Pirellulaceae bacterium]
MWKKVVAPTVLVSVLWLVGSGITTYYLQQVYASHASALSENVTTIRAAWAMLDALWQLQVVVVEAPSKEPRETQIEATERQADFEQHLQEAEDTAFTADEHVQIKAIREHFSLYRDHIQERLRPTGLTDLLVPQAAERAKTMRLARGVADPCRQLLALNERMLANAQERSTRLGSLVNVFRNAFLIAGPILGLLCGLWIARGMHRSISQISVTLKGATGELDQELSSVEIQTPGDFPELQQLAQAVTERVRHVVTELEEARRQAMSAERLAAVGELAAGIAHELRNPLTSVKLLIQTATQQLSGRWFGEQDLQVAQREIARMEGTIQGLLDFARPPTLRRVIHDVRSTVQRALNLVEGRAKQQQVNIVLGSPRSPVMVDGDPEQIHQVLVNLLLNGVDAMPGGGTLEMTLNVSDGGEHACRFVVRDSGAGIPPQILSRLFEPFVTSKEGGTGLGLAISRRIAEEHGGTLLAVNREAGGAMFTFALPLSTTTAPHIASHDEIPGS